MRTNFLFRLQTYVFIAMTLLLASCSEKDLPKSRTSFKVSLKTRLRVAPSNSANFVLSGTNYVSLANLIATGEGDATLLGKVKNFSNALSYGFQKKGTPVGAYGNPVKDIPSYPVTGGQLPLIQAGDFSALPGLISAFKLPSSVQGMTVNVVIYNTKGEALFLHSIEGSGVAIPKSKTQTAYTNQVVIVGGTGKYKNAVGQLDNKGYISMTGDYTGEDEYDGWISY